MSAPRAPHLRHEESRLCQSGRSRIRVSLPTTTALAARYNVAPGTRAPCFTAARPPLHRDALAANAASWHEQSAPTNGGDIMARLSYPSLEELADPVRTALEQFPIPLNVFRMMAHAQSCFIPWLRLGTAILADLQLASSLRELIILLVAHRLQCPYEWVQHVPLAQAAGVKEEQIQAITEDRLRSSAFSEPERALLEAASEWLISPRCQDDTWSELCRHFSPREIVEAMVVVGFYSSLARILETTQVELDRPFATQIVDR